MSIKDQELVDLINSKYPYDGCKYYSVSEIKKVFKAYLIATEDLLSCDKSYRHEFTEQMWDILWNDYFLALYDFDNEGEPIEDYKSQQKNLNKWDGSYVQFLPIFW